MPAVAKQTRPLPDITSLEDAQQSTYGQQHAQKSIFFPSSYRLIVTTTRGVYAWDMDGVTELFRSGSEGIVAAKKLSGTGEMLAVADSQVVVLHDIKKGMQKSYRLKGSEVGVKTRQRSRYSLMDVRAKSACWNTLETRPRTCSSLPPCATPCSHFR